MRTLVLGLALAAGLLLLAPDALAGGWSFDDYLKEKARSDWEGYGVGTMTHRRITQVFRMAGQPDPKKTVAEEKKTISEITETEIVIKVESLESGQWTTTEEREKKGDQLTPKVEDQGTETVTLDGTDYECAKKKVEWMKGEKLDETAIVWAHPEKGILKIKVTGKQDATLTVTDTDASWTVGEHALEGRVLAMTVTIQMGMKLKGKAHMSQDVPGSLVKNDLQGSQGPAKLAVVMELIAFTKK